MKLWNIQFAKQRVVAETAAKKAVKKAAEKAAEKATTQQNQPATHYDEEQDSLCTSFLLIVEYFPNIIAKDHNL